MILILDLGSLDKIRITRKIRALGVYAELHPHNISSESIASLPNISGIILDASNQLLANSVSIPEHLFQLNVPILSVNLDCNALLPIDIWPDGELELNALLNHFLFDICKADKAWNVDSFIAEQISRLSSRIQNEKVLLALSGGVDSAVTAALLSRVASDNLICVHVNHGFLRKGESEQVQQVFHDLLGDNLIYVDAAQRFLAKLLDVSDPELKRKIIGEEFIRIFEDVAHEHSDAHFLAQGTIYTDVIESGTLLSSPIKAHHNVGGLPSNFNFKLIEPLKMLFKDEVRACGLALGLPDSLVFRQPFPGPGLAVRCLGAISPDRLNAVREADAILNDEFFKAGLHKSVSQFFAVIPDFRSTGIRNNSRSFDFPVIIRAVNSTDLMTAEIEELDYLLLKRITRRITSEVPLVNRVLLDLTPKPTGTIEWE